MKTCIFLLLSTLLLAQCADINLSASLLHPGTFSATVPSGSNRLGISAVSSFAINIRTNASSTVTLSIKVINADEFAKTNYTTIPILTIAGLSGGIQVDVNPASAFQSASVATPTIAAEIFEAISDGSYGYAVVTYNSDTNVATPLISGIINEQFAFGLAIGQVITVAKAPFGENLVISSYDNTVRFIGANQSNIITYNQNTVVVNVTPFNLSTINVVISNVVAPSGGPAGLDSITPFQVTLNGSSTFSAVLAVTVPAAYVAEASSLQLGYYDTVASKWVIVSSSFDAKTNLLSTTTTHFSTWSAFGKQSASSTSAAVSISAAYSILFAMIFFFMF